MTNLQIQVAQIPLINVTNYGKVSDLFPCSQVYLALYLADFQICNIIQRLFFLEMYCLRSLFVYSFSPRSHEEYGWEKKKSAPSFFANSLSPIRLLSFIYQAFVPDCHRIFLAMWGDISGVIRRGREYISFRIFTFS